MSTVIGQQALRDYDLNNCLALPRPPVYKMKLQPKRLYRVPQYFGYDHRCTRWILAMLNDMGGLRRLKQIGLTHPTIFTTYYQIPDIPSHVSLSGKTGYNNEISAYNKKAILYLTPVGLAVYLKCSDALVTMLDMKNDKGEHLINVNAPLFVQKVHKRGQAEHCNDLSNTNAAIIAVRRNYMAGLRALIEAGYESQRPFTILYRKPYDEVMLYYSDILDYSVELLKTHPGTRVAEVLTVICDPLVKKPFDLITYNLEEPQTDQENEKGGGSRKNSLNNKKSPPNKMKSPPNQDKPPEGAWISLFRRTLRLALKNVNYFLESGAQLIALFDEFQRLGYFRDTQNINLTMNKQGDGGNKPAKQPKIWYYKTHKEKRIFGSLLNVYPKDTRDKLIDQDKAVCVSMLIHWLQIIMELNREAQMDHLLDVITKIFMDTFLIELFFDHSDGDLCDLIAGWNEISPDNKLKNIYPSTISALRYHCNNYLETNSIELDLFYTMYKKMPKELLLNNK